MFSYASSMAVPVDPLHLQNEKSPQLFDGLPWNVK